MEERTSMQQQRAEDRMDTKPPDIARLLLQYIEQDTNAIIGIFRSRVRKAGLASKPEEVQEAALELLNEVYIEAAKTAHSFDSALPCFSKRPGGFAPLHHPGVRWRGIGSAVGMCLYGSPGTAMQSQSTATCSVGESAR